MQSFFYEESSYNFTYFTSTDYPSKFWYDSEQKKLIFENGLRSKLRWKSRMPLTYRSKNKILLSNLAILMPMKSRKSLVIQEKMEVYLVTQSNALKIVCVFL